MVDIQLIHGDCLEVMRDFDRRQFNAVVTDPPYPDYHVEEFTQTPITWLDDWEQRQIVFWSAKCEFPLSYSAIHIWDKKTGCGSMYERIFERNGGKAYRVFRHYLINSTVAASYTGDKFTGHKSQKPISLMVELLEKFTNEGDTVLDPFLGSGTTAVACAQTGRNCVGIEIDKDYYDIACQRVAEAQAQMRLPLEEL